MHDFQQIYSFCGIMQRLAIMAQCGFLGAQPISGILEKRGVIGEGNNQRSFKVKHLSSEKGV